MAPACVDTAASDAAASIPSADTILSLVVFFICLIYLVV
jgi:hypothetical protein